MFIVECYLQNKNKNFHISLLQRVPTVYLEARFHKIPKFLCPCAEWEIQEIPEGGMWQLAKWGKGENH